MTIAARRWRSPVRARARCSGPSPTWARRRPPARSPPPRARRRRGRAMAGGDTPALRPAAARPFGAWALAAVAEEAGVPAGVFNVVTGSARAIGGELTRNPAVGKLTFTGSTEVGIELTRQ